MNLILCGLPMCGKTTIGKRLADHLNCQFIDTDRLIENRYLEMTGQQFSCRQIFLKEGESIFREIENKQIGALAGSNSQVIALGGGSLNDEINRKHLQSIGHIIYLSSPTDVLWQRVSLQGLPAYLDPNDPKKSFYALAEKRTPVYEASAHVTVDTALLSPNDVVGVILQHLSLRTLRT